MTACIYSKFCGKRMAHGDRADGCSSVDQRTCDPSMPLREETPTAAPQPPYMKCINCYRTITLQQWTGSGHVPLCQCGLKSWAPV